VLGRLPSCRKLRATCAGRRVSRPRTQ